MSIIDNFAQAVASYLLAGLVAKLGDPSGLLVQSLKTELSGEYQTLLNSLNQVTTQTQQLLTNVESIPETLVNDLKSVIPFPLTQNPKGE